MDRIRRDLADPDLAHLSACAIAARRGFRNPSHFGKLFRAEFGRSPGEFRQQIRHSVKSLTWNQVRSAGTAERVGERFTPEDR
jgi:AraC-like DNA-binding protein